MSWQHQRLQSGGQTLPVPEDGIVASNHGTGRIGRRWESLWKDLGTDAKSRDRRGKNYARRGRARGLHISPGVATAEVVCDQSYRPSLRVRAFTEEQWLQIQAELLQNLAWIASLLEGELPQEMVLRLEEMGLSLVPTFKELSFDCDCGDYIMPCTHVSTVFHVLTDALDGDPFLLLSLRGRAPHHLLSALRASWGDDVAFRAGEVQPDEVPDTGDWFSARGEIPSFACRFEHEPAVAAGLKALGPPPGQVDLIGPLRPIYQKAHEEVIAKIEAIPERKLMPKKVAPPPPAPVTPEPTVIPEVPVQTMPLPEMSHETPRIQETDYTEALVDILAESSRRTAEIAKIMNVSIVAIRAELSELEELGLVYQTGKGRNIRWHLG